MEDVAVGVDEYVDDDLARGVWSPPEEISGAFPPLISATAAY
jgi:hypothetical protein